jgi:CRP-like cAMP-binding protein
MADCINDTPFFARGSATAFLEVSGKMKKTVPEFILDGSIVVDSVEAFGSIIKEFPDRPELLKMYAEMLAAKKLKDAAIEQYQEAARLFLDSGRLFQSWVSKILQWRLQRPSREELLEFHRTVAITAQNSAPVDDFIKNLTPAERMAVFSQFRRMVAPAGKTILKAGDFPHHLYMVVAGVLKENCYEMVSQKPRFRRDASRVLCEADCFGDIYPFSEKIPSQSDVVATTRVEVVMISRQHLMRACRRHPSVENGIIRLCRIRFAKKIETPSNGVRKGQRYSIPTRMSITVLPNGNGHPPITMEGYSRDLSITGVSFIPEGNGAEQKTDGSAGAEELLNRDVRVTIPANNFSVAISGRIVRNRQTVINGKKIQSIGIQFAEIPPRLRGAFFVFAESAKGETLPPHS